MNLIKIIARFLIKTKKKLQYNGIIGSIIQIIIISLTWIGILMFGGRLKNKLDKKLKRKVKEKKLRQKSVEIYQTKENILEEWKNCWIFSGSISGCGALSENIFCDLFVNNYNFVKYKERINCEKNFRAKKIYVVVLFFESIAFLAVLIYGVFGGGNILTSDTMGNTLASLIQALTESGMIGLGLYIFAKIVAKWIDIAKYQETWIRHSNHVYMIEEQMFLYILGMAPYDTAERNNIFQQKALEIWRWNQQKFVDNMENKERPLL